MRVAIVAFASLFLFGCSPSADFTRYNENNYTPTQSVDVLHSRPIRAFVEIGELSVRVRSSNRDDYVLELKRKARSIGANAIIIEGEESHGSVAVPIGGVVSFVNRRYAKALAIRYKEK